MRRAEELINAASNRYRITVQVAKRANQANRASRRRREDHDISDESGVKPVMRAILEMSEELTQLGVSDVLPR